MPALLLGYATQYYVSVTRLPRPETNLLLIGPVYWLLVLSCAFLIILRLVDLMRKPSAETGAKVQTPSLDIWKSVAFVVLTAACIWAIPVLGFVITTLTYTFLLLLALQVRSMPVLLLTPPLLIGLIWVGMEYYLNLRLPTGLLL